MLQQELNEIREHEEIYYHIEFQDETRTDVNPFRLRNFLSDKCNQKVEELTKGSKNGFSFKVEAILQRNLLSDIKKFEELFCETTYTIYIAGQPSDTVVDKYQDQPMICDKCHKYRHTKTR